MNRAVRTVQRAVRWSIGHRLGKLSERTHGCVWPALFVLLISLLLSALLVRTGGRISPGGSQLVLGPTALACWGLVLVGIAGTTLAARGVGWGWLIQFGLQPLWIAYAIVTRQHGFILAALAYALAQLNGFARSRVSLRRRVSSSVYDRRHEASRTSMTRVVVKCRYSRNSNAW